MKALRLISAGLIAVLICVNFTACNDDDEEDDVNNEPGTEKPEPGIVKRLKQYSSKLIDFDNYEYSDIVNFEYDQLGRIAKITHMEKEGTDSWTEVYEYVWEGNTIKEYLDGYLLYTFTISDKLVRDASGDYDSNNNFSYNSSGKLTTWFQDNGDYKCYYRWKGDKITEFIKDKGYDNKETLKFSYGNEKCSGYYPIACNFVDVSFLTIVHPELFGCIINTLPTKAIIEFGKYGDIGSYEFTHELDKDGYLVKAKSKEKFKDYEDNNTEQYFINNSEINFVWE